MVLNLVGAAAAAIAFAMFVPQAMRVWRLRDDASALAGVSPTGQWLLVLNATLWAVYGLGVGAVWTAAPSFVNLPLALVVIYLLRRAAAPPAVADAPPATTPQGLSDVRTLCGRFIPPAGESCTEDAGHETPCSVLPPVGGPGTTIKEAA